MAGTQRLIYTRVRKSISFPYKRTPLKSIISTVLDEEDPLSSWEIGCHITDDASIRKLNREYRGIDSTTDVLSFALSEDRGAMQEQSTGEPGHTVKYGEIVISYPRVVAQASEYGHSNGSELALLLVHGTLHLLGYDHMTPADSRKMRRKELKLIKIIEQDGGLA